jgi:hypothetical protein
VTRAAAADPAALARRSAKGLRRWRHGAFRCEKSESAHLCGSHEEQQCQACSDGASSHHLWPLQTVCSRAPRASIRVDLHRHDVTRADSAALTRRRQGRPPPGDSVAVGRLHH